MYITCFLVDYAALLQAYPSLSFAEILVDPPSPYDSILTVFEVSSDHSGPTTLTTVPYTTKTAQYIAQNVC